MTQQPAGDHRHWTEADIPDLSGQTAVVTGANTGLGLQAARVLAGRGAHVVLACRNVDKAGRAADKIAAASAGASVSVVRLDLASQSSVRSAAEEIRDRFPPVDLLINNAGVMDIPYQRTEDGFELTLATNHLGPFALTGLLLDRLAAGARIVTVSSVAHLHGVIDFDDLQSERGSITPSGRTRSPSWRTCSSPTSSTAASAPRAQVSPRLPAIPGSCTRSCSRTAPGLEQFLLSPAMRIINFWGVQDARMGALPQLRAATDPSARGGQYFGPRRYGLRRRFYTGYPAVVESSARSHDEADQARLWQTSEKLTGVSYPAALG